MTAQAALMEVFATGIFVFVILVQTSPRSAWTKEPALVLLSIASTLGAMGAMSGPISGGCINPAVGFGINLAMYIDTSETESFKYVWLYLLMPLVGSAIATGIYDYVYSLTEEKKGYDED